MEILDVDNPWRSPLCLPYRSGKSHHNFSLTSFVGVIQHAGHKRVSQGPLGNKLNAAQVDSARPSSSQSVATQFGMGYLHLVHNSLTMRC